MPELTSITVKVEPALLERLEEFHWQERITRSAAIRRAVAEMLERQAPCGQKKGATKRSGPKHL